MAKIKKIIEKGSIQYPATITDAVKNPNNGKTVTEELSELGSKVQQTNEVCEIKTVNALEFASRNIDKYVMYENGFYTTAGVNTKADSYIIDNIEQIRNSDTISVFVGLRDSVPAAIAFYKSTDISPENYISGVQGYASEQGAWFTAIVPSNTRVVVVSNVYSFVSVPTIKIINSRYGGIELNIQKLKEEVKDSSNSYKRIDKSSFPFEENKYVSLDGSIYETTSKKTQQYKIDVRDIDIIVANLHSDGLSMAIAFYDDEPDSKTYMSNYSLQGVNGQSEYNSVVPFGAKYALITGFSNMELDIWCYITSKKNNNVTLLKRDNTPTDENVDLTVDLSSYILGTKFRLKFGDVVNDGGMVYVRASDNMDLFSFKINKNSVYYLEKTDGIDNIRIYKAAEQGSIVEFEVVSLVNSGVVSKLINPTYQNATSTDIDRSKVYRGYWLKEGELYEDYSWVCYAIQYSTGYKIKINCTDFNTYYVALKLWSSTIDSYTEKRIAKETIVDLSDVYAWHVQFRRQDRAYIEPSDVKDVVSFDFVEGDVLERPISRSEFASLEKTFNKVKEEFEPVKNRVPYNPFRNAPFYAHYASNDFIRDGLNRKAIASESLEDIDMAARLGFGFIEANIHKNASGDYVCIHGSYKNENFVFGPEVYSLDGSDAANMVISDTTTEYMNENIRYNSDIIKYRTKVPFLQEFCKACKSNNIGIFAGTSEREAIEMCVQILGQDNVIVYNPPSDIRQYFNGLVYTWTNSIWTTKEGLIKNANTFGRPYMCGIGPTSLSKLKEDGVLELFIKEMHQNMFLVGIAAVYQTEEEVRDCFKTGVDFAAAGHEVNPFAHNYEIFDLDADVSQFTTNGVISDNIANLAEGDSIECGSNDVIPMGKAYLTIRFSGTIDVNFGSVGNRTITSDGTQTVVVSDYLLRNDTHLKITSRSNVVITSLTYKTSKC